MTDTALTSTPPRLSGLAAAAAPIARLLLAAIFVLSGWGKIGAYAGTAAYMESAGVPAALLPLVILVELGGGLALAVGWQARFAALALAGFTLIAAVLFHGNVADQMQQIMFLKNVAIAGGLLMVVANGAGAFSLDGRRRG
jgi:putative oxidoreductase